jgi:hypothetical protein
VTTLLPAGLIAQQRVASPAQLDALATTISSTLATRMLNANNSPTQFPLLSNESQDRTIYPPFRFTSYLPSSDVRFRFQKVRIAPASMRLSHHQLYKRTHLAIELISHHQRTAGALFSMHSTHVFSSTAMTSTKESVLPLPPTASPTQHRSLCKTSASASAPSQHQPYELPRQPSIAPDRPPTHRPGSPFPEFKHPKSVPHRSDPQHPLRLPTQRR